MTDHGQASNQLLDLLCEEPPNVLRIRSLCRDHPGLIASAGVRLKIWSFLVLGSARSREDLERDVIPPQESCAEQHVLEADVHRTRADVVEFRSPDWRRNIQNILQKLCVDHGIQYKQGMNEVLAPFIFLNPPPKGQLITYALFRAFLFRYLERFFCVDDSAYLFKAFRMFHLLLLYFDPQLAYHLSDLDFIPELYSPQWFLTLFARALPLAHVLRVWDMIIAMDDSAFVFFIGLCLIRSRREELLMSGHDRVPEIISQIHFKTEDDIDEVMKIAIQLYSSTPRCVLRNLRLCCVSTVELTPFVSTDPSHHVLKLDVEEYDQALAVQSARSSLVITPQELVDSMLPSISHEESTSSGSLRAAHHQQYVIIDVRAVDHSIACGGGTLPRAIQLEPEFLNRPEAFDIWLQHFDGTRGCNIVIVDLPAAQWAGVALWRRLLLGEGDGNASSLGSFSRRYEFDDLRENKRRLEALLASSMTGKKELEVQETVRDSQSKYFKAEAEVAHQDLNSPAMLLAIALQRNAFSNVSVLDGGFPALVNYLMESRGSVEPIIINHNSKKWEGFLKSTGRHNDLIQQKARLKTPKQLSGSDKLFPFDRKVEDLTDRERWELALQMAERLGHVYMKKQLEEKLRGSETLST
eukprot:gene8733-9624_t